MNEFFTQIGVKINEPVMKRGGGGGGGRDRVEMQHEETNKVPKKILSTQVMHGNPLELLII